MRPRDALWAFAAVLIATLVALALRGFAWTGVVLGGGVAAVGFLLEITYLMRRRLTRVLPHRSALDWHVRAQLVAIAATGAVIGLLGNGSVLAHASPVVQALVIGVAVAVTSIYLSSLVDWYWILPKISGMTRSGLIPCVDPGGETWSNMTGLWHFHRAVATTLVTAVLAAVPGYLAGRTGTGGTESAAWVLIGSALAIGFNSVTSGVTTSFRQSFNPSYRVGDIYRIRPTIDAPDLAEAYIVDVSTQGVKYKLTQDLSATAPEFKTKGSSMTFDELRRAIEVPNPIAPCSHVRDCRAANWYCFRNVNAQHTLNRKARAPAEYDMVADDLLG